MRMSCWAAKIKGLVSGRASGSATLRLYLVFHCLRDRAHDALLLQGREVEHYVSPLLR